MSDPIPTVNHLVDGQLVDSSLAPSDRTFRNAWKLDSGAIEVDMTKAREMHKQKLREMRKPKLEALDSDYMRADEGGKTAEKKAVAAKKQALRDVTSDPAIEAAQTPEELKAVIPAALQE
jgi:hypothetical protein